MLDNIRKYFNFLKVGFFALILFLMTMFSLRFDPDLKDLDDGVYSNYLTSMVTDQDLNIIDQLPEKKRWMVTSNYNHPTLHDHGVSIFWLPSYLYSKILKLLGIKTSYDGQRDYRSAMVISNGFYFLLLIVLALKVFPLIWNRNLEKLELLTLIFSTPLFWYGLIQPSSADVTTSVIPFFLIIIHLYLLRENKSKIMYFYLGALISIGIILKVTLLFYCLLPLHLIYQQYREKVISIKNYLVLFIGAVLPTTLFFTNEHVKYGSLGYSYAGIVGPFNVLWEILLGPSGYITVSPIYLLVIVSGVIYIRKNKNQSLFVVLLLIPIMKILAESYSFQGNADFGGRHLIADTAILALAMPFMITGSKVLRNITFAYCIVHTVLMASSFYTGIAGEDYVWGALYTNPLNSLIEMIPKYNYFITRFIKGFFDNSILELLKLSPLFIFFGLILSMLHGIDLSHQNNIKRLSSGIVLSCLVIYISITALNVLNNKVNVQSLKENGFFEKLVVVDGAEAFYFYDNVSNLLMHKKFLVMRGKEAEASGTDIILNSYYKKVQAQILVDPIGLKKNLESGKVVFPDPFFGTNKSL